MDWKLLVLDSIMQDLQHDVVSSGEEEEGSPVQEEQKEKSDDDDEEKEEAQTEDEEGSDAGVVSSDSQADEDVSSVIVASPLSITAQPPAPLLIPSSSSFHSIAADVRIRRRCEKHGEHCPTHSPPHLQPVTTKVLHLSTNHRNDVQRSVTSLLFPSHLHLPSRSPPFQPLTTPVSPHAPHSDAVHQRIITGLTSPASVSSAKGKSFLFPPPSSLSSAEKENRFSSPTRPPFQLSPKSAFSPIASPSTSPMKRRKTIHASPPSSSLGGTFHTMEADGGRGRDRTPKRLPR